MKLVNVNNLEIAVFGGAAGSYSSEMDLAAAKSGIIYGAVVTGYSGRGADTVAFDKDGNVYVARSLNKKIDFKDRGLMGRQFRDAYSINEDGSIKTSTDAGGYIRVGGKTPKAYQMLAICAACASDANMADKINKMNRIDIHHLDKDHRNNSVDNLMVLDHDDHKELHKKNNCLSI